MTQERRSVIVTFKPKEKRPDKSTDKVDIVRGVLPQGMTRFFDATSLTSGASVPSLPPELIGYDVNEYEAPIVTAQLTQAEIDSLKKNGNVARVYEDYPCYAIGAAQYSHLQFEDQPSVQAETVPAGVGQIQAPAAWPSSQGEGVRVAVLDTGIDRTHPDLVANYRGGVSFVPGATTPMDDHGHGTHCAGTIAAPINGVGVVGVAPSAYLYAVKVLNSAGSGSFSQIISGIDWAIQNRMHIVSMSLGGGAAPAALETICNTAWSRGLLLVAAAGNSGTPVPPATSTVGFPAKYKNVIAVSAINSANSLASFSSRGPEVDVCAPGVNVLSTTRGAAMAT